MENVLDRQRTPTKAELKAALTMTFAVAEAIREAREIPSGTLYAMLLGKVDFAGYQALLRNLKGAGLVSETASLLKWVGPEVR